jgi:hypothetical protein
MRLFGCHVIRFWETFFDISGPKLYTICHSETVILSWDDVKSCSDEAIISLMSTYFRATFFYKKLFWFHLYIWSRVCDMYLTHFDSAYIFWLNFYENSINFNNLNPNYFVFQKKTRRIHLVQTLLMCLHICTMIFFKTFIKRLLINEFGAVEKPKPSNESYKKIRLK